MFKKIMPALITFPVIIAATSCSENVEEQPIILESRACGFGSITVEGKAIYQDDEGNIYPVIGLQVSVGTVENKKESVQVTQDHNGRFSFQGSFIYSTHKKMLNDHVEVTEVNEFKDYVLSAKGCEDYPITVSHDWEEQEIVMDCKQ